VNNKIENKSNTSVKNFSRGFSTLGSGVVAFGLAYGQFQDVALATGGGLIGAGVGGMIVFKVIPDLVRLGYLGVAVSIGLGMSATWVGNGAGIIEYWKQKQYLRVDARYLGAKERYSSATIENIYISLTKNQLKFDVETLKKDILSLTKKSDITSGEYKRIRNEIEQRFNKQKRANIKAWSNGGWAAIARTHGCRAKIGFNSLVSCASRDIFTSENIKRNKEIAKKELILHKKRELLNIETSKESSTATKNHAEEAKIAVDKKIVETVEKQVKDDSYIVSTSVYLIMWILGLIVEVFSVMWGELMGFLSRRKKVIDVVAEKESIITEKKEKLQELTKDIDKASEIRERVIHNIVLAEEVIAFANTPKNVESDFKSSLRKRYKNGKLGDVLPMAHAIIGAVLYSQTIKRGGKIVQSWFDMNSSSVLFVNGDNGRKRKNRDIAEDFLEVFGHQKVKCLGSTATTLSNVDIRRYLAKEGINEKGIDPQLEALTFLRTLETSDAGTFSPINLSVDDFERLTISFILKFHPNHFN